MKNLLIAILILIPLSSYASDSDFDGINDTWEMAWFGNLTTANTTTDYDNDGLSDLNEYIQDTNPKSIDTDGDFMTDGWEVQYGFDPNTASFGNLDFDNDGVVNSNESISGSSPFNTDTDGDGLSDSNEFYGVYQILSYDMSNSVWFTTNVTVPTTSLIKVDSDGDGVSDSDEIFAGTNPNDSNEFLKIDYELQETNGMNYLALKWPGKDDRGYLVETTTNVINGIWIRLPLNVGQYSTFFPSNLCWTSSMINDPPVLFTIINDRTCIWRIPVTNNVSASFYRVVVGAWYDWKSSWPYTLPYNP